MPSYAEEEKAYHARLAAKGKKPRAPRTTKVEEPDVPLQKTYVSENHRFVAGYKAPAHNGPEPPPVPSWDGSAYEPPPGSGAGDGLREGGNFRHSWMDKGIYADDRFHRPYNFQGHPQSYMDNHYGIDTRGMHQGVPPPPGHPMAQEGGYHGYAHGYGQGGVSHPAYQALGRDAAGVSPAQIYEGTAGFGPGGHYADDQGMTRSRTVPGGYQRSDPRALERGVGMPFFATAATNRRNYAFNGEFERPGSPGRLRSNVNRYQNPHMDWRATPGVAPGAAPAYMNY